MSKEKPLNPQQVVKMKQGMSYSCKEKTIILNVFKYFTSIYPEKCVTELVRRTAKATGCSEKSVFQFRKEEASAEGFKQPSKTKVRKNVNINSRFMKYDSNVRQSIRNIIYDLKCRNVIPSLNTILKNINNDDKLPNFSLMTLRRLLFDMGFCYEREKVGSKPILVERLKKENAMLKKPQQNPKSDHNYVYHHHHQQQQQQQQPPICTSHNIQPNPPQMYLHNQNKILPMPLSQHENHYVEPPTNMMNQRVPSQIHPMPQGIHPMTHGHKPDMCFVPHAPPYHHPTMII